MVVASSSEAGVEITTSGVEAMKFRDISSRIIPEEARLCAIMGSARTSTW